MEQSAIIAANLANQNNAPIWDARSEDAYYFTCGKDHLTGLKSGWLRVCGVVESAAAQLRVPATRARRRA